MSEEPSDNELNRRYDEDGYCVSCGIGYWRKGHYPWCYIADLQDELAEARRIASDLAEGFWDDVDPEIQNTIRSWENTNERTQPNIQAEVTAQDGDEGGSDSGLLGIEGEEDHP